MWKECDILYLISWYFSIWVCLTASSWWPFSPSICETSRSTRRLSSSSITPRVWWGSQSEHSHSTYTRYTTTTTRKLGFSLFLLGHIVFSCFNPHPILPLFSQVGDEATLKFIHDRTAAPYFSNLVWFIGNNVLMMERCLRTEATHLVREYTLYCYCGK